MRRQQRVPAQFEEAVFAVDATDLQHLLPDLRQLDFQRPLRCATGCGLPDWRGRQRGAVEFAVAVEGQRGQHHQLRRQHVVRQALAQGAAHGVGELPRIGVQLFIRGRHHIADQLLAADAFVHQHRGFADHRQALQVRLQLTQFDAESANFHLMVDTPQVFQCAILAIARQVAAAVQPRPRCGAERIGNETLGAQTRTLVIALGEAGVTADAQLADATGRQQVPFAVQYIQRTPRQRAANRHANGVAGIGQGAFVGTGNDRGFGWPVGIEQAHIAQTGGMPQLQAFERHGLATDVDLTQAPFLTLRLRSPFLGQQEPVGGRQVGQGHAVRDDLPIKGVGVP
ncbi:hypothetical protein D3C85_767720 [compost metagenome]